MDNLAITINVQNNQSYPQNINVMGSVVNLLDTANAVTEYAWDFTAFTFTNENTITVQYKANNASSFSYFTATLKAQTLQAIVDALNTLNIGYFYTYVQAGATLISTYNDNYTFTTLNVYAASLVNPIFNSGTGFNNVVSALAIKSANTVLVGGEFSTYQGTGANGIISLNSDGSIDTSFTYGSGLNAGGIVNTIVIQSDGKILVGGQFTSYNGTTANNIIRLNQDGTVDTTFTYGTGFNGAVNAIKVFQDGSIICGGNFSSYNGNSIQGLVKLQSNGTIDNTFSAFLFTTVNTIALDNNGGIYVGGSFTVYSSAYSPTIGVNGLIKLQSNGANDTSFNYGSGLSIGATVYALSYDATMQQLVIGGNFSSYNGNTSNNIVRVNSYGTFDTTFAIGTGFNGIVSAIAKQSDSKIIVSGSFSSYNGTTENQIVRLNQNGSIDTTWNTGTGFNGAGTVAIKIASNGTLYVGGYFTIFNGNTANKIANLYN